MAKNTKFSEESAAASTGTSPAVIALFNPTGEVTQYIKSLERRNMPAMYKPGDVPVGGVVSGEIIKIVDSPVSTVKGKLIWLRNDSGIDFTFPATGVIRNALAPGVKDDADKLTGALEKEIGKMFYAKRMPDKQSTKYKKPMFMFDVFTGPKKGK